MLVGAGNGGARRPNDINICEPVGAYENTIPVSQVTGTIHDDAVRGRIVALAFAFRLTLGQWHLTCCLL